MHPLEKSALRLADIIRLLASDNDGETLAAARALQRTLKAAGADLNDLGDLVERAPQYVPAGAYSRDEFSTVTVGACRFHWQAAAEALVLKYAGYLNEWGRNFANSIRFRSSISQKQHAVLTRLCCEVASKLPFEGPQWDA
jgi:hypothetical protein